MSRGTGETDRSRLFRFLFPFSHPLHHVPSLDDPCCQNEPGKDEDEHTTVSERGNCGCPGHRLNRSARRGGERLKPCIARRSSRVRIPSLASVFEKRVKLSNWVSHTHSSKSTIGSLFLKLHEIFIPWAFVRIHTIHGNPLPFPRVEPGRARHFFSHWFMESW